MVQQWVAPLAVDVPDGCTDVSDLVVTARHVRRAIRDREAVIKTKAIELAMSDSDTNS